MLGSPERLQEPLVFSSQQMEATAPQLRHTLIREEERKRKRSGREGHIVQSLRLLPILKEATIDVGRITRCSRRERGQIRSRCSDSTMIQ